jgi:hypothetical protein
LMTWAKSWSMPRSYVFGVTWKGTGSLARAS